MLFESIAAICTGLFAGAAVYITLVEHPVRLEMGVELALRQFVPSYRRAAVIQASLAAVGCLGGLAAWMQGRGAVSLIAALLIGSVIPFTLVVVYPVNKQLHDPRLDPRSARTAAVLHAWGRLHAVRSVVSAIAFAVFVWHLARS